MCPAGASTRHAVICSSSSTRRCKIHAGPTRLQAAACGPARVCGPRIVRYLCPLREKYSNNTYAVNKTRPCTVRRTTAGRRAGSSASLRLRERERDGDDFAESWRLIQSRENLDRAPSVRRSLAVCGGCYCDRVRAADCTSEPSIDVYSVVDRSAVERSPSTQLLVSVPREQFVPIICARPRSSRASV